MTVTSIVTKREELAVALAQAEAAREYLEAALAKAEAALVNSVTDAARIDANWAEANAKVDKVRARCRQLHAALADPDHAEFITRSRERMDTLIKQSEELSRREATASPPSIQSRDHALRGENKRSEDESRRRKLVHRFNIGFSARERREVVARSPLVRQTIGLLALVLTYLLYFHIDVQLQILRLPSLLVWALQ
jgi:chromosome segregation ATPase